MKPCSFWLASDTITTSNDCISFLLRLLWLKMGFLFHLISHWIRLSSLVSLVMFRVSVRRWLLMVRRVCAFTTTSSRRRKWRSYSERKILGRSHGEVKSTFTRPCTCKCGSPHMFREECPDARNSVTLREVFPPPTNFIPPPLHTSSNALFTLTTQWAPSSYYHVRNGLTWLCDCVFDCCISMQEVFGGRRLILMTVVMGEVRVVPEPQVESDCMDVCSGFKGHPVLRQGDSSECIWT